MDEFDIDFGAMCLAISPSMHYLVDYADYPKDLWTKLDRDLSKHNKDHSRNLESAHSTSVVSLFQDVLTSTVSEEFVHDEEVSHIVHVATILFDSNASSFYQEANIEEPPFLRIS